MNKEETFSDDYITLDMEYYQAIESGNSIMIQRCLQKRIPSRDELEYGIDSEKTSKIIKEILKQYIRLLDSGFQPS